jgi:aminoglycoside 6'-N-acetyltransferase
LRSFREDDAPVLAAYRSDPEIARYQSWRTPVTLQDASTFIHQMMARDVHGPGWFQYAVILRSERALVGDIGINLHENEMQADIGFTVAAKYQGCGYATEMVWRVLEHLFVDRGLHRVSAECDARNLASARLLMRLGFRREGCRVANTWLKGEWTDDIVFGMLETDWRRTSS